jgi:hypothetical protein
MAIFYIDPIMGNDSADGSTLDLTNLPSNIGPKKYMSGITAANLNDGDEVRMVASPPWNTGTTFTMAITDTYATMGSGFTLADLGVKLVSENNTAWTAATNVTANTVSDSSFSRNLNGTNTSQLVVASAFTTGKMAHIDLGSSTDLSTYNCLNFHIRSNAIVNNVVLNFCSDSSGDTIIESITFSIPAVTLVPLCLFKSDLSFFPNNVRSISLQVTSDPGTPTIIISQMWAGGILKSDAFFESIYPNTRGGYIGFNIWSMFGASGMEYFPIRYLDFTNNRIYPLIGSDTALTTSANLSINSFANYTNEPLYAICGAPLHNPGNVDSGFVQGVRSKIGRLFEGGYRYNGTSNVKTNGHRSYLTDYKNYYNSTNHHKWTVKDILFLYHSISGSINFINCVFQQVLTGSVQTLKATYKSCIFKISATITGFFENCVFYPSRSVSVIAAISSYSVFKKCTFEDASVNSAIQGGSDLCNFPSTTFAFLNCIFNTTNISTSIAGRYLFSQNHNDVTDNHKLYRVNSLVGQWQTTEKQGSDPGAWELITAISDSEETNFQLKLAEFAVNGSGLVTINAWVKKSHATEIDSWILVGSELTNAISQNYETVSADNTNWQQLQITFTPDEAGVITLYACAQRRNTSNTRSAFFGSINITQA